MTERVGAYRLAQRIGAVGTGEVLLAELEGSQSFSKRVVLKRILPVDRREERVGRDVPLGGPALGHIEPAPLDLPAPIRGHVAEVTLGEFGGCARSDDGAVYCSGCNTSGAIGTGATLTGEILPPTRVDVPPIDRFRDDFPHRPCAPDGRIVVASL